MEEAVVSIKLMFDWQTGPLWIKTDQYAISDPYSADEALELVQLSDTLVTAITKWDEQMQATYDGRTHENLGFADPQEEKRWIEEGRELAQQLKNEVGAGISVKYVPLIGDAETIELRILP